MSKLCCVLCPKIKPFHINTQSYAYKTDKKVFFWVIAMLADISISAIFNSKIYAIVKKSGHLIGNSSLYEFMKKKTHKSFYR